MESFTEHCHSIKTITKWFHVENSAIHGCTWDLGCCLTFGNHKKTLACGSCLFALSKVSQHPVCMDHAILHRKPFATPYDTFNPQIVLTYHFFPSIVCLKNPSGITLKFFILIRGCPIKIYKISCNYLLVNCKLNNHLIKCNI